MTIRLVAGLGNPGAEYRETRHNAGAWFVEALARRFGVVLREEPRFLGLHGRASRNGDNVSLLVPTCFMNLSGQSLAACARFYRIAPGEMLVVHDEIDLDPGTVRLKTGGGHGGHNGLRDIVSHLGSDFHRLRIGVGHPGSAERVVPWVLSRANAEDMRRIGEAIERALDSIDDVLAGDFARAMNVLHQKPS
ncbi:MAG: aminoacyl-tRNA hydrolase [Gammaproteobacteria bacterium]|nr:aminoacyl-tRNA hydrolase [Gammaproteobacteria bacterium]